VKTMSIQQARTRFDELLELVGNGHSIEVTNGAKPIARIVPAGEVAEDREVDWSDAHRRLEFLWNGKVAPGMPASQIIIEDRR